MELPGFAQIGHRRQTRDELRTDSADGLGKDSAVAGGTLRGSVPGSEPLPSRWQGDAISGHGVAAPFI